MATIAVTGSASGIGGATAWRLREGGHRVIGVDVHDADVIADLGTSDGRDAAATAVIEASGGVLDGAVTCAGLGGLPGRPGAVLADVNYFGTVDLLVALRPALAAAPAGASVVVIGSNSTTIQPGVPLGVVDALLAGDRDGAARLADEAGAMATYPATKLAVSRWARRISTGQDWIGAGVRVNVVAPGMVDTALVDEQRGNAEMAPMLDLLPIPVGRPGRPEEIAALIDFLLGPDASFMCGSIVLVDGGSEAVLRPDDWPSPWMIDLDDAATTLGSAGT